MEKRVIPFSPPDITEEEVQAVADCLRSGWITTGPRTKQLERELAKYIGTEKVVCLNSATAAEELNLRILGIGPGDEVIVPAYTYTATAAAAIHVGATIVMIDSQVDNPQMDYDQMEAAITEKTKAIIPVDLGGVPCDYDRIFQAVENKKELFHAGSEFELGDRIQKAMGRVAVVADCAHSLGASYKEKMTGNVADFSSFSFHAVKNFTTGEGGAAAWRTLEGIDNEEIYMWYQLFSLHGQSKDALSKTMAGSWEYDVVAPLYKCNMTDIMASIGLKQLERYSELLRRRRVIIEKYDALCEELGIDYLIHFPKNAVSSGHLYLTRIPGILDEERREIMTKLAKLGISTNVHYKPLPLMSGYKALGWDIKDFPNAFNYYSNLISLPLHTLLEDEDIQYVTVSFRDVVEKYLK
ncbi:DegT/DnrJ/EryC1/StrS family aminotransferase [Faecalibaculum rodentium]|uniref:DegT/DnrJ/EryC1/StrS family aminotransferase n=1 Tax=Faecalibaculum rodentium TaxID=1702221 RepID=UPI0023EF7F2F|nr:DegT/DnrJ/EryC1/StrS aminotransferase family protein [Faecalibaculum rodentium]